MPEEVWDQSEIYLALGRGEALVDTGGADELLDALAKHNTGPPKTYLEAEHGLRDKLAWDAEETRARKGTPTVAPVPLTPNRNLATAPPVEGAPVANESPALQGAPDILTAPENLVVIDTTGQSDHPPVNGKVPSVYSLDRLNPLPATEVVDLIDPAPTSTMDYEEMVRRTLTNAPTTGQPDANARPFARKPATAGEPVDLFTGTFVINVCDLTVPTPHVPIAMTRSYRSGKPYYGPFGYGWDHTYNVYLRELEGGAFALWTGQLREVHFAVAGAGFEPEPGFAARLEPLTGVTDVYDIQLPGGLAWRFERPAGWTDAERIPLTAITDRHGNTVRLGYSSVNKVESVMDAAGRGLLFHYGSCELLERVTDHTGSRIVRYWHDPEIEHLVEVVLPATAQYADGLRTTYDYDRFNPHPAMQHNILRIHDAEDRVTVENEFAGPENGWEFNAVVKQRMGGYEYGFEYQQIQLVWPDPAHADVLATRTLVRPPDGSLHTYTFNYRGDLLDHRLRLNRDKSYRVIASQWRHDAEGNVTETIGPDGLRSIFTFDSANPDPCARRNLQRVELVSPLPAIVPSRIVFQALYDPRYQLVVKSKDEAGAETIYKYDFDLMPASATGRMMQVKLPQVVLADGTAQQSTLTYEHNPQGQVTAAVTAEGVRTELAYVAGGSHAGLLSTVTIDPGGANRVSQLQYDSAGFGASATTATARTTTFRHNGLGQVEEVLAPTMAGANAALRRWFDDTGSVVRVERPAGSFAGLLAGTAIVDEYERDEAGHLRRVTLAANTIDRREWLQCVDHEGRAISLWDPLGTRTDRVFAENGTLLSETAAAGDTAAQKTTYSYDRAGRVTRILDPSNAETRMTYDVWGRPHTLTLPTGAVRHFEFGMNDTLLEERLEELSGGAMVLRQRQRFEYDSRGRLVAATVFSFRDIPGAAIPLTTRYLYDKDDRLRELLPPRGARHSFDFDSAGRLSQETDVHGNVRQLGYDGGGDLRRITLVDRVGAATRTRTSDFTFDARGRLAHSEFLDTAVRFEYDDRDLAVEQHTATGVTRQLEFNAHSQISVSVIDPGGLSLRSTYEYDLGGRLRRHIDPMGMATAWDRDALGRPSVVRFPDGTAWRYFVDAGARTTREQRPSGNVIEFALLDASGRSARLSATPGPGHASVAAIDYSFDGLRRLVQATTGADALHRRYDSLDRVVEESTRGEVVQMEYDDATGSHDLIYPDGRRERTEHNVAEQPTRVVLITPGSLGGVAGTVLLEIFYSASGLPERLRYGNGVEALLARDDHDRVIRIDYRLGGALLDSCRQLYDSNGHHAVVQHLGVPLRNLVQDFDTSDRLVEARAGFPLAPLADAATHAAQTAALTAARAAAAGAAGIAFVLDDADTREQTVGVNGGAAAETYVSGSDHRIVSAGANTVSYSLDGHRILDSRYKYELDALNRVVRLRDAATNSVLTEMNYDALSRVASGTNNGRPYECWFAGSARIHESTGPGSAVQRQHSSHPLWMLPFCVVDASGHSYVHQDQGWSTMCLTDSGGAVVERHRYDVFGASATFAADGVTPLVSLKTEAMWRGMPALGDAQLFRTPHRLYDPSLGVFTSRDPHLYADSPSPYAFAAHNPADFADSTGLDKTPMGKPPNPVSAEEPPTLGDRILDGLGEIPGSPLRIRTDVKTVMAMVKAFNAEKSVGSGVLMAANVLNPLYHAEVARFQSGEAADRGEYGMAVTHGFQAAVGYAQTLAMAAGAARGLVRPTPPVAPPVRSLAPSGGFPIVVAEGKPVVRLPALNVEMNTAARAVADAPLEALPEAVPGSGTWATAEGVSPVRSGFAYPGYEGNLAAELFEHANANGIELRPHGFFDRLPNLGAPGAWASTHAELKVVYRNPHVQFVEVNRAMCKGCRGSISQIVMQRGMPVVVLDPKGFWYFTSDAVFFPTPY